MPLQIVVTAKQVIDPEMPLSAFQVDRQAKLVVTPPNTPPVVNGFDENAVEAALRIKDTQEARITVVSMGTSFSLEVMKKPLAMGVDELVLLQDHAFINTVDSYFTASVLAAAMRKLGGFDLIISGRQASDWDNAQTPLGLAEMLGIPCITTARNVVVKESRVVVERIIPQGYEVVDCPLPALVTVSNELGQLRYPTLRGIMAASRKQPVIWNVTDLGIEVSQLSSRVELVDLFMPVSDRQCEFIQGDSDEEKGRNLALKLREAKLI